MALITLLVLFIAALGEGLGNGNREYISKLDADLIVYQAKSDFLISASRLGRDRLAAVRRVDGVADAGMLGTANATLILPGEAEPLKVSTVGRGTGPHGRASRCWKAASSVPTRRRKSSSTRIPPCAAGLPGDTLSLRVTQGTEDEFYELEVVGITDGQQYSLQPSIFVPFNTWDRIRPEIGS